MKKKILIIKHGSFGDIVLATGAMRSISSHFHEYEISLLTSSKYVNLIDRASFIDNIIIDDRKSIFKFLKNFLLIKRIINSKYTYIFDLQNSKRTCFYNLIFRLFTKSIISSSRPFSHKRYIIPLQGNEHVTEGLNNQLSLLEIKVFFKPNVDWLKKETLNKFNKNSYVIFIPGTSKSGIYKRWSPKNFAIIAKFLEEKNIKIIVVGTLDDMESAQPILSTCLNAENLLGESSPTILYNLSLNAKFIISNDTGPALLASLTNTPLLWIVNDNNISKSNKPVGDNVIKICAKEINQVSVDLVKTTLLQKKLI